MTLSRLVLRGALAVAAGLLTFTMGIGAAKAATGTVITSGVDLNIRSGPGTGYGVLGSLSPGSTVFICVLRGR
jgi:uncharacterized protein YraI